MDYKKKVIKHFSKLQFYVQQAATTKSFPTRKQLDAIHNRIDQGKKMVRELPVRGKRADKIYLAVLDTLLDYRPGQSVYILANRASVINWAGANKVLIDIDTIVLNDDAYKQTFPGRILKVTLKEKNYAGEDDELQRGGEGEPGTD